MTQFILGVIEIAIVISVVITMLLLLSYFFGRRFSAKCRYLIWLIVVIRLCVPFGTAFLPSLFEVELPAIVTQAVAEVTPADNLVNNYRPEDQAPVQNPPATVDPTVSLNPKETQSVVLPEVSKSENNAPTPTFEMPSVESILTVCGYVWLAVAAAYLIIALARYSVFIYGLIKALIPASEETTAIYTKLCKKQKIRRAPALYVSKLVSSPILCGYFRQRIILPDIALSNDSLAGILAHELTHYRRHDLWIKLLCVLATSIHWFNPLVHIAAKRCNNEMELSCDESVLSGLNGDARLSYGNVMLDIIKRCRKQSGTLTTQFNPKKSAVKERFNNILDMTKKKRGVWIIAVVAAVCIIAGTVIGCSISGNAPELDITDTDSEAILSYLENKTDDIAIGKTEGDIIAASYELLGIDGGKLYLYVNKGSYHDNNGTAEETGGAALYPVVLYAERNDGKLIITKHASPREGKYYGDDMKKLFPVEIIRLTSDIDVIPLQAKTLARATEKLGLGNEITPNEPATHTKSVGPFVGYIKDAETDSIDLYTKENGDYIMSIPYAIVEQFPATDRTNPAYTFGLMNADFYCGKIGDFVWAAVCTGTSMSVANNNICTSSDGGKSWTIGDSGILCSSRATGALFISENVGFMTHEYREDFGPVLYRTTDGGKTWERVTIYIPASMSEYKMTPQAPTFDGNNGVCKIAGYDGNGNPLSGVSLVSTDGGMNWMLRDTAAEQMPLGYTLLSQDNTIKLYAQNDSIDNIDADDGVYTNFWLTYTDNDGISQNLAFTGSGYDIAPDSVYSPRIYTADANGDYWYDIAIVFTTGSGTGVHNEELRLFAGRLNTEIPVESAVSYLNSSLKITSDSDKWTLKHGEKSFTIGKAQFSGYAAADIFDEPAYHRNYSYHVLFDKIYCDMLLCCAGSLTGYANEYLRVGYTFGNDSLDGADVSLRYAEGGTIMTTTDKWANEYSNDTGSTDHFTLRLNDIGDALLEVTLDEYNIPFASSFTAEGQTKRFDEAVQLYGNINIGIFRADGMTVFDKLYYGYGDTYVFHKGGVYTISDRYTMELPYTTYLYTENGKIRFCRQSMLIRQADLVQTGFSAIAQTITSRDDFFRSYGKFSIDSDGNAVFTEDKRQTLSDVYDLDAEYAEFIKLYPNGYPATLDELIAKNIRSVPGGAPQALITYLYNGYLPQGANEILYCGRISMNPYYICLFRTSPKSVCVYTIWDDLTHYNSVNVMIPDGYDYDIAEAIWAGGRGGSGESQFWVELEKNGVYTYLRYDNFAYTDNMFDYRFDGKVPSDELISYAEAYGVPVKYPNTNTENSTDTEMDITITEFTDESWAKLNHDGTISEQCREFFYNFVSGKSDIPEYNALGITDWKITRKDELFNMFPSFIFEFTVTGDSLDALPPGHYVKYINDIRWTVMYDDLNIPTAQAQNTDNKYAQMVYKYLKSAYIWDIRDFGEWNGDIPVNYIIKQHGGEEMQYDDFVSDAKKLFGIENVDEERLGGLIYEADGIKMIQTGGTGSGFFADIPEVNEVDGNYEVIVQLYADINGILPSHRLKYTLGKDGEFLRFEILEESRYEPEGLSRIYTI